MNPRVNPQELLHQTFGFSDFRPGQKAVVDCLLAGRSALAVFPTGSGKSLCYQLPALLVDGLTVVVSPLLSLMKDQVDQLKARGIGAARLDSTQSRDEQRTVEDAASSGDICILYVAPERLAAARFVERLKRTRIALLAVDEAHCISEWGHNFRPEYLRVAEVAREIAAERVLALTATATPGVVADIQAAFSITPADTVATGFARPNLILRCTPCAPREREAKLLERLHTTPPGPTIVYVTLQKTAERVAALLKSRGIEAEAYHAGMDDTKRAEVQDRWMAAPDRVVVATIAFGMGIDKADVRRVFHFNLPKSLESYSQEIGRAGRDGADSWCEVFASATDLPVLANFAAGDTPSRTALDAFLRHLLDHGDTVDVAPYAASARFDIRILVLRTLLTYLELENVVRLESRGFAKVEFKPLEGWTPESIAQSFGPVHGTEVAELFSHAEKGRLWYRSDPAELGGQLGVDQQRVLRMLDVLEDKGMVELRASDQRLRYRRTGEPVDIPGLVDRMAARFEAREDAETRRLAAVVDLLETDGCRPAALAAHFGETGLAPCGRCNGCTGESGPIGPALELSAPDTGLRHGMAAFATAHPREFGEIRQRARYLCGISSPAASRLRLGRKDLYGALEHLPIPDVMAWLAEGAEPAGS